MGRNSYHIKRGTWWGLSPTAPVGTDSYWLWLYCTSLSWPSAPTNIGLSKRYRNCTQGMYIVCSVCVVLVGGLWKSWEPWFLTKRSEYGKRPIYILSSCRPKRSGVAGWNMCVVEQNCHQRTKVENFPQTGPWLYNKKADVVFPCLILLTVTHIRYHFLCYIGPTPQYLAQGSCWLLHSWQGGTLSWENPISQLGISEFTRYSPTVLQYHVASIGFERRSFPPT